MRRFFWGSIGVALLVSGCGGPRTDAATPIEAVPAPAVTVVHPIRQPIQHTLQVPGDVDAWYKAKLYAKVAGYLKTIQVDKGDAVAEGQLLATIDSPELAREVTAGQHHYQATLAAGREDDANLLKAQSEREVAVATWQRAVAQVKEAQAAILKAQSDLKLAQTTYGRLKTVYDKDHGLLAVQDVDVAEANVHAAEARLASAEEALAAAKQNEASCKSGITAATVQIDAARQRTHQDGFSSEASRAVADKERDLYAYTEIRAPFSGSITARYLDPGALVQDSANSAQGSAQPVLALEDTHVVRIYVQVPQSDAGYVHKNTPVTVQCDELAGRTWRGEVTRLSGTISEDSRTMLTEIDLPNGDHALRPGMMVVVRLQLASHPNALTVPTTAVGHEGDKRYVFTVVNNVAHKVEVQTGFEEPSEVEITHGLTTGDDVVRRQQGLKNGQTVQVSTASDQAAVPSHEEVSAARVK